MRSMIRHHSRVLVEWMCVTIIHRGGEALNFFYSLCLSDTFIVIQIRHPSRLALRLHCVVILMTLGAIFQEHLVP